MATVYSKNPDVVFRKVAGECILVPIRNKIGDMEAIYTLNETAARAWELIDGRKSVKDIGAIISAEFDVPQPDAERDLEALLAQLKSAGTIVDAATA